MSRASARVMTVIPATINIYQQSILSPAKRRAAVYARVSTDKEEQETSFEAQVDFFTKYIHDHDDLVFVECYTDEGISATSTKKREGFKRMVTDALEGKIDLIVTKSVSRFARNTVDTLTIVRQLREKGVEIFFHKEQICTLDAKGELLITIMSSLAQEESRSISENTTWGQRKRMADGKITLPYGHFLGYERGEDGFPKIVEKQAVIVRQIYTMFLQGRTVNTIARYLTDKGIPTPGGKEIWRVSTVLSILQNEKYKGDALLQKEYTVDYLTKKKKKNNGEVQQYYIENSHPAIIVPEVFDLVQVEIKKRKSTGTVQSGLHPFSSRIKCGSCGGFYGPKLLHSNTKYRRIIWRCNSKYKNDCACQTPHLYETAIQKAFVDAFNTLYSHREQLLEDYGIIISILTDTAVLDTEEAAQQTECDIMMELIRKCVEENTRTATDQGAYKRRYEALVVRYEAAMKRLGEVDLERQTRAAKRERISRFMDDMERIGDPLAEFDEQLWCDTVDTVTVNSESNVAFSFRDGSTIHVDTRTK